MTSAPQLAGIVLSLANEPGLIDAVRSLLTQETSVEICVVNSGGGDPESTLRAAGINVPVISREERLYVGAVRNLGVEATKAPFIAFLAADCIAEPGWAAGRIEKHQAGAQAVSSAVTNLYPHSMAANAFHVLDFTRRLPGTPLELFLHYSCSYRRELFLQFGPFREDLRTGEDTEFHVRLSEAGVPFTPAPEVRLAHRNPTSLAALLKDQYSRGVRYARTLKRLRGKSQRARILWNTFALLPRKVKRAWTYSPQDRKRLLYSLPWVCLAVIAKALGVAFSELGKTDATPSHPHKIYALTPFYNEMKYLPGFFKNVLPQVDGIIALDHGSTDGSAEYVAKQPGVLELLHKEQDSSRHWSDRSNRILLYEAAAKYDSDWILVVDCDERLEKHFKIRALNEIARADREGHLGYSLRLRELWDTPDTYRADGIWGKKWQVRLFKWRPDAQFDDREHHLLCAPVNSKKGKYFPPADLIMYHLRMIQSEDRAARRKRYEDIDPENNLQKIGYAYLTDPTGLALETFSPGREYEPIQSAS